MEFVLASGLLSLQEMIEDEVISLCGERYKNLPGRLFNRWGTTQSEVILGGKKITIERRRVRETGKGGEKQLKTLECFQDNDLLAGRQMEHMVIGVSTRKYNR
jgi:putative transposase